MADRWSGIFVTAWCSVAGVSTAFPTPLSDIIVPLLAAASDGPG